MMDIVLLVDGTSMVSRKRSDKDPDAAPGKRQKNILSFFQRQ